MAKLTLNHGSSNPQMVELRPGLNKVGRAEGNDIQISDPSVSSFHCELVVEEIATLVRDLGSTNGTYIEGQPIKEKIIQRGQTLVIGKVPVLFEAEEPRVSVPELSKPEVLSNLMLENGAFGCLNHPEIPSPWFCTKCVLYFCDACVRRVGLEGGAKSVFCQICSTPCQSVIIPQAGKQKKSFFGALGDTLRIFRK